MLKVDFNKLEVNLESYSDIILAEIEKFKSVQDYSNPYSFINLARDQNLLKTVQETAAKLNQLNPTLIIVVGIGGSNLGALAIAKSLQPFDCAQGERILLCVDTIDSEYTSRLLDQAEAELKNNKNIIVNIISKSGKTSETIINGSLFVNLLKKYKPNYKDYIIITTDRDSALWQTAKEEQITALEIPKQIGGRFSVLAAAGLLPLELLNIQTGAILDGAASILNNCLNQNLKENFAAKSACLIYQEYKKNKNILDLFLFSPNLESLGHWYRQLVGESLGKNINTGITPTVSIGTTDLHSVAQLYLGGPNDKFTCFVSIKDENTTITVPENYISKILPELINKSISDIKVAILKSVKTAYSKNNRDFFSIELPELSEYYLGQFLMFKMCQIVYLGALLKVNAFDQPAVELYKKEIKNYLN